MIQLSRGTKAIHMLTAVPLAQGTTQNPSIWLPLLTITKKMSPLFFFTCLSTHILTSVRLPWVQKSFPLFSCESCNRGKNFNRRYKHTIHLWTARWEGEKKKEVRARTTQYAQRKKKSTLNDHTNLQNRNMKEWRSQRVVSKTAAAVHESLHTRANLGLTGRAHIENAAYRFVTRLHEQAEPCSELYNLDGISNYFKCPLLTTTTEL